MDDATRLIGDLQLKLAQLDDKVSAYRQDMALEFRRYSGDILQHLPHDISSQIQRRVVASFSDYPALGPELQRQADSPLPLEGHDHLGSPHHDGTANNSASLNAGPPSPSANPENTTGNAAAAAAEVESPLATPTPSRERDAPFHGVFTPNYLPLFDGAQTSSQTEVMGGNAGSGKPEAARDESSVTAAARASLTPPRPYHERRPTNETTSSGGSDYTDSKYPRSAMRRTSSGGKPPPSPRRVRFEFEGGEVLPTSSPQTSEISLVQSHSLHASLNPTPPEPILANNDVDVASVESILGPDEDSTPPPKKVSSSQALRALSRTPLDADTIWTVVNAESPEPSDRDSPRNVASPSPSRTSSVDSPLKASALASGQLRPDPQQQAKKMLRSPPPEREIEVNNDDEDDDDDDSSDDDFLAMAKPKSFANKKAIMSPVSRSPPQTTVSPPTPTSPQATRDSAPKGSPVIGPAASKKAQEAVEVDEEDMFHFEGGPPSQPRPMPAPIEEDEEEDAEEPAQDGPTLYSTSPAVTVPKTEAPLPPHMIAGSVGSFKGRSVHMPVVKDPDVYAQAASLRDISSFIGGVDGRSGADEGDLASYRASVGQVLFSGTPRSLGERMMMEEAQKQRRAAADQQQP